MAIPCRHRNRLVPGSFVNLLDGGTGHRQPRTKGVTVQVPDISCDLDFGEARHKPRTRVESCLCTSPWEYRIELPESGMLQGHDCGDGVGVQVDCSSRAILRLRQLDGPTIKMYLRPCAGVLLLEDHGQASCPTLDCCQLLQVRDSTREPFSPLRLHEIPYSHCGHRTHRTVRQWTKRVRITTSAGSPSLSSQSWQADVFCDCVVRASAVAACPLPASPGSNVTSSIWNTRGCTPVESEICLLPRTI